jgi:hypothetical protein
VRNVELDKAATQMAVMINDTTFCSEKAKKIILETEA